MEPTALAPQDASLLIGLAPMQQESFVIKIKPAADTMQQESSVIEMMPAADTVVLNYTKTSEWVFQLTHTSLGAIWQLALQAVDTVDRCGKPSEVRIHMHAYIYMCVVQPCSLFIMIGPTKHTFFR